MVLQSQRRCFGEQVHSCALSKCSDNYTCSFFGTICNSKVFRGLTQQQFVTTVLLLTSEIPSFVKVGRSKSVKGHGCIVYSIVAASATPRFHMFLTMALFQGEQYFGPRCGSWYVPWVEVSCGQLCMSWTHSCSIPLSSHLTPSCNPPPPTFWIPQPVFPCSRIVTLVLRSYCSSSPSRLIL